MSTVSLTHIGGPTILIEFGGWRILTDPTFDTPGRTYKFGWGTSSAKTSGPRMTVEDIGRIDVVLLSHDHHADNLDVAGRALLPAVGRVITTTSGAMRLGGGASGLAPWDCLKLSAPDKPTIDITATPCRHGPAGSHFLVGDVIGFSLRWAGQEFGDVWISGDTVLYSGVRDVATRLRIGTALLHIGGVRFPVTGPFRYTMTAADAVELCQLIKPHTAIPIHYEGWSHFHERPDAARNVFARASEDVRQRVRWIGLGEPIEIVV